MKESGKKGVSFEPDVLLKEASSRKISYVDRMSRRLTSAKAFLDEDKQGLQSPLSAGDGRPEPGKLGGQLMQASIASFIRQSIKQVKQNANIADLPAPIRQSIVQAGYRMSIAAKQRQSTRDGTRPLNAEEKMNRLNTNMGNTVFDLKDKKFSATMSQPRLVKKVSMPSDSAGADTTTNFEEGDLSMFESVMAKKDSRESPADESRHDRSDFLSDLILLRDDDQQERQAPGRGGPSGHQDESSLRLDQMARMDADDINNLMLNDLQLDPLAMLENFENLEIENIKLDGDVLEMDLDIKIDVPDYLDHDISCDYPLEPKVGDGAATKLSQQIEKVSKYIAQTASLAQEKMKDIDFEPEQQFGQAAKPTSFKRIDEESELDLLGESEEASSDGQEDSGEDVAHNSLFDESAANFGDLSRRTDDLGREARKDSDEDDSEEDEDNLPVLKMLEMQKKKQGKEAKYFSRATTIMEVEEEKEDDSFEREKAEKQRNKRFKAFDKQLEDIQHKVEEYTSSTKAKMRESISQLTQLRQRASLLQQKKKAELAQDG